MLKKIRIALAAVFFVGITLLLAGIGRQWFGWMAKLQFLPACLALNVAVIVALVLLTFVCGRIYCSVICPLGVWQDIVLRVRRTLGKWQMKGFARRAARAKAAGKPVPKLKRRIGKTFGYKPEHKVLRYAVWAVFVLCLVLGIQVLVALIAPYSAYGRIVTSIVHPHGWVVPLVAFLTLACVTYLAWTDGRSWCNNICPVGTTLSFISRFSLFRMTIDESKCIACGKCYRNCKASCIDGEAHKVDCSRCVVCFDCVEQCSEGALRLRFAYGPKTKPAPASVASTPTPVPSEASPVTPSEAKESAPDTPDLGKRAFMLGALMAGSSILLNAQEGEKTDGGLAVVIPKKAPKRENRLVPPGAKGVKNFYKHCTACQLCVANCPNNVLRPSTDPGHLMQPKMDFDRGFCRPECTTCSQVCPAGAILPITKEEKTMIHVGRAVVDYDLCVAARGEASCGKCAAACPAGAVSMVRKDASDRTSPLIPSVIEDRCIGCGKCEYLCPSRPISAIHVEGLVSHIKE
jgi:polyferredoxin